MKKAVLLISMTTSIIGSPQSQLGQITLGILPNAGPRFGFQAHVLSSKTIRVIFDVPVNASALNIAAYVVVPVPAVWSSVTPSVTLVEFYGSDYTSVVITLSQSLTLGSVYSIQLQNIISLDRLHASSMSVYNVTATVPDPPRAYGAYMSEHGHLDLVFDRPVQITSDLSATAQLSIDSGTPISLTLVVPHSSVPLNNIQFSFPPGMLPGTTYLVTYQNVIDYSFNAGTGAIPLDIRLRASPYDLYQAQITGAFLDKIDTSFTYVSVFYDCPMLTSDTTNLANWSITKDGVHAPNIVTELPFNSTSPTDDITLTTFCAGITTADGTNGTGLIAAYDNHLSRVNTHFINADTLSVSAAITLINNIRVVFNTHIVKVPVHTISDRNDLTSLPPASTIAQAITLVADLKNLFNSHIAGFQTITYATRVGQPVNQVSTPYHSLDDSDNHVFSPNPTTIMEAAVLADELRTRLLMHVVGPYHVVSDPDDMPTANYCLAEAILLSTYPNGHVFSINDVWSSINEIQLKYRSHILDSSVHFYADDVNMTPVYTTVQNTTDGITAITAVRASFNGHIQYRFPVTIDGIQCVASDPSSASSVFDAFTYFTQLRLNSFSPIPSYYVAANIRSLDYTSQTSSGDTTGQVTVNSMRATPEILSLVVHETRMSIRFSQMPLIPRVEDILITGDTKVQITGVELSTTPQATQASTVYDTLDIYYTGLKQGDQYTLNATLSWQTDSFPLQFKIQVPFQGVAQPPCIASALPDPGLGRGSVPVMGTDTLSIYFSSPMRETPIDDFNFSMTGPTIQLGSSYWLSPTVLSSQVSGMRASTQYGLDMGGLYDSLGNPINLSILPFSPMVSVGKSVQFTLSGGSQAGLLWAMIINESGGSIDSHGYYVAGMVGMTSDTIKVTDSLGNSTLMSITIVS